MSIEDDIATLARVPMLNALGRQTLRMIAVGAETREVAQGEVLFPPQQKADCAYVVQSGSFRLGPDPERARRGVAVGPGAILGEFVLLTESAQPFTALAQEPGTVMRISRSMFRKILETDADAAVRLRDYVAHRAATAIKDVSAVAEQLATDKDA